MDNFGKTVLMFLSVYIVAACLAVVAIWNMGAQEEFDGIKTQLLKQEGCSDIKQCLERP